MRLALVIVGLLFAGTAVFLLANQWLELKFSEQIAAKRLKRLGKNFTGDNVEKRSILHNLVMLSPFKRSYEQKKQQEEILRLEREMPACLEVIALGMQAGMGFDQAFTLYTERFDTALARKCARPLSVWKRGLKSREVGLRELSQEIGTASFKHFASSVLRALRFGAPLAPMLIDLAQESRKEYRAKRQEIVAKAPVKMLLPTGALILPAMLLLVMGPIILDLVKKMG